MCSVAKPHLTLCNPMDCSPPGSGQPSSVLGISQASILEWVAISFSTHSLFPPHNQELQRSSQDPLNESQPCRGNGACVTLWRRETCCAGPPKWMGQSEEFWQNKVHWTREWQTTPGFLPQEPHKQYENQKMIWHQKMSPLGRKMPSMLLGKSGGQLWIAPEIRSSWVKAEMTLSCRCVWWWK